jgi:hypothetical protein
MVTGAANGGAGVFGDNSAAGERREIDISYR